MLLRFTFTKESFPKGSNIPDPNYFSDTPTEQEEKKYAI